MLNFDELPLAFIPHHHTAAYLLHKCDVWTVYGG